MRIAEWEKLETEQIIGLEFACHLPIFYLQAVVGQQFFFYN